MLRRGSYSAVAIVDSFVAGLNRKQRRYVELNCGLRGQKTVWLCARVCFEWSRMKELLSSWPKTFKEAFCERFRCPPERYEQSVFWRCLHRHAIPVAMLIRWINPEVFREDFDLIREIGGMNDPFLFRGEVDYFHGRNVRHDGLLRRYLRVRVSGRRVLKLKDALFNDVS